MCMTCNCFLPFEGAVLFNLHATDLFDELALLLNDLSKAKMPLWQQMHVIEILSATLVEDLIANKTVFHLDPEEIIWPDGTITRAPTNERKGKGKGSKKKSNPNSKFGVFGKIVHEFGLKSKGQKPEADTVLITADEKDKQKPTPSTKPKAGKIFGIIH